MSAHLQGIDWLVWEICEDATYVVLEPRARVTQDQKDRHNANSRARSVLFLSLSLQELESLRLYYCSRDLGESSELSRGDHTGQNQTLRDVQEGVRELHPA